MKIAKLLVLSALLLLGSSVRAAVPDGVWTIAEPTGLAFTDLTFDEGTTHYYLYNPAAKMFFASGNDWSTRASIAAFGYEVWFQTSTEEDAPAGSYEFWDDCQHPDRVLGFKNMFTDDGGATWVDHAAQANYSWSVTKVGDSYRIQNVALVADLPDFAGKYIGWKGDYSDTRLYMLAEGEGAIDWKAVTYDSYQAFLTSDAYAAYKNSVDCYSVALQLKAVLEEGEAIQANIAGPLAVYNNTASTLDELNQAIKDANAAIEARKAELVDAGYDNATVENPVVVTDKFIKNPDFKGDDLTTGWSGDAFGSYGPKENAEHYNKTYNTYQTVTGLKPGIYAVGVKAFYRAGNADPALANYLEDNAKAKYAKLYGTVGNLTREVAIVSPCTANRTEAAGVGSESTATYTNEETGESITSVFPNNMEAAEYYMHTLGLYDNKVLVAVGEEGELTLGVKKTSTIDGDWSIFDDFSLTYYGQGADACKLYLDEAIPELANLEVEEGTLYTQSYMDAYKAALEGDLQASNIEELNAVMSGVSTANSDLQKNISLWKDWQAAVENAKTNYVFKTKYEGLISMDDLADYCDDMNVEDMTGARALTNEELEAEIQKIADMIQAVITESLNSTHEDGEDMTDYIVNPGFDDDKDIDSGKAEGWTIDSGTGGNITRGPLGQGNKDLMESALGYMNYCFEAWHRYNWDVWQEIENLPKGMYELSVQGYVRCEVGGYQRGDDINPDYPSPIYLYMNSATAQFPSVYSEDLPEGKEYTTVESWTLETINDKPYPNSMGGAAQCFGWGMYEMKAYGLIAQQGDKFRIGVKMEGNQDWWCIWDNFKLTYRKPTVEIVQPILEAEIEKINLSEAMGSEVYEQVAKAKEDAQAAIASGDGEQMFDALVAVYEATDAIRSSVVKFRELTSALETLAGTIPTGAIASIRDEAQALYDKINNGVEGHTIATSEVDDNVAEITKMMNRLGLPAGMDQASDANPVECTTAIINPAYVDGNDNGWTGGAAINAEATDAEKFSTNYNYYQVLQGMPAGTYQVKVQGYFRAGNAAADYTSYIEDPTANNNAFLYAVGENNDTCSVAMLRLASQTIAMEELSDGYVWASEADKLAVPNSMTTAGDMFMTINEATGKNYYADNTVTVKVGEDGRLTIGLKKKEQIADDWTIWSNWQLFYYGTSSSLQPNGDPSAINSVADELPAKVEFFNLNGARINKPAKGVAIMKQTLSDGKVKVTKVIIK